MLELHLKKKKYSFPNSWGELTTEQFIYLIDLLRKYQGQLMTATDVRIMYFLKVAGLIPRRFRKAEREEMFSTNVYKAAVQLNFFFKYVYENVKAFAALDPELQDILTKNDPEDLPDEVNIRAARKLKRHMEVNMIFAHNLVPDLPGTKLKGYKFKVDNGFLDTTLTASQYVDAYGVFEAWDKSNDSASIDLICGILFQVKDYSAEKAHKLVPVMQKISNDLKYAVMLNYMAIHLFMSQNTKYAILFDGSSTDSKGKITLGFHDSIYSLIKSGYGKVEDFNLVKFLDLMLKELKDGVKSLHDGEMKVIDIAKKTKLTIAQVNSLI